MKPGGGHCLSQWLRNWNIPPCVNVEVNELSSTFFALPGKIPVLYLQSS